MFKSITRAQATDSAGGHVVTEKTRIGYRAYAVVNDGRTEQTIGPVWGLTERAAKRTAERVLDVEFAYHTGSW